MFMSETTRKGVFMSADNSVRISADDHHRLKVYATLRRVTMAEALHAGIARLCDDLPQEQLSLFFPMQTPRVAKAPAKNRPPRTR